MEPTRFKQGWTTLQAVVAEMRLSAVVGWYTSDRDGQSIAVSNDLTISRRPQKGYILGERMVRSRSNRNFFTY